MGMDGPVVRAHRPLSIRLVRPRDAKTLQTELVQNQGLLAEQIQAWERSGAS